MTSTVSLLPLSLLLLACDNEQSHEADEEVFQHRVIVEEDGDHAQVRAVRHGLAHYLLSGQPHLPRRIQVSIIDVVVVTFRKIVHLNLSHSSAIASIERASSVPPKHSVHDGDVAACNLKHNDVACSSIEGMRAVGQSGEGCKGTKARYTMRL